jgi:hypothetical protein
MKNVLNLDSCLSNNVCRNCVNKNSNLLELLLKKVNFVRERFNVVEINLIEKNQTTRAVILELPYSENQVGHSVNYGNNSMTKF